MAFNAKFTFDTAAIRRMRKTIEGLGELDKDTAEEIGSAVVDEIRSLTGKGISPIDGGRFPAYKAVVEKRAGYPQSVRGKYPAKKNRPVNLRLSNDFMDRLKNWVTRAGKGYEAWVGWRDAESQKKEQGHREEANGQPMRPVIPQSGESLTPRIMLRVREIIENSLARKLRD
jgi:hypothetical protein